MYVNVCMYVCMQELPVITLKLGVIGAFNRRVRWICLLGVQVAVEREGWMVLAIGNYDYATNDERISVKLRSTLENRSNKNVH